MSQASLNGEPILSLDLEMACRGPWTAVVEIDADEAPTGQAILAFESTEDDATKQFIGTIRTSDGGSFAGRSRVYIVAGAGGLRTILPPRSYVDSPPARLIVADILREAGEVFAPGVEAELDTYSVNSWERAKGEAGLELSAIVDRLGLAWRVLANGSVWIGRETWAPYSATRQIPQPMSEPLDDGVAIYAPPLPTLAPGVNLDGRRIGRVAYSLESGLRARVTFLPASTAEDREAAWFRAAVLAQLPELPYLKMYEATVVSQAADGTLEVQCGDEAIGGLSRVPIWLGLPGVRVKVAKGARVLVGFMGGRRDQRYASLWATNAGLVEIAFDGGTKGIARIGDTVDLGTITGTTAAGPVTFTYTPPGGLPEAPTTTLHVTEAEIATGAAKVKG